MMHNENLGFYVQRFVLVCVGSMFLVALKLLEVDKSVVLQCNFYQ